MARLTRRTRPIPPWTDDGVYMGAFQGPDDQGLPFVESMTKAAESLAEVLNFNAGA